MRTKDTLFSLGDITTLLQYLYLNEDHKIQVDNGLTKIEIRMTDNCGFRAKNPNFPDVPEMRYDDSMNIPNMLAIIQQLKKTPPCKYHDFESRWAEIEEITSLNFSLNKANRR